MQKDRYLFRGQKVDAKEWVYGYYMFHETKNKHVILTKESKFIEVIPETVGQLRHKNKHGRYFDGDIYYHAGFGLETVSDLCEIQDSLLHGNEEDICEIKGNIHENPELLK